jgi:hypothetical protein
MFVTALQLKMEDSDKPKIKKELPTDGASTWSSWWGLCVPMTQRAMPAVA